MSCLTFNQSFYFPKLRTGSRPSIGLLKMAECLAARLSAQEEQIRLLTKEISSLRDGVSGGFDAAGLAAISPELESLRVENEKLRYRLLHLRRGLQAELELEKEALRRTEQAAKTGKPPEKNTNKHPHTNNRANNRVIIKTWTIKQYKCIYK